MVLVVLNIFYSSVEKSYINQMSNVISMLDRASEFLRRAPPTRRC